MSESGSRSLRHHSDRICVQRAVAVVSVDSLRTGATMALGEGEGRDGWTRGAAWHRASEGTRSQPTIDSAIGGEEMVMRPVAAPGWERSWRGAVGVRGVGS